MELKPEYDELIKKYEKNPLLKGLIQLIPFGAAAETTILTFVENIRYERTWEFFDELAKSDTEMSLELLESEDFIHAYFSTMKFAINSRRREKIKLFARLFRKAFIPDAIIDFDYYEELLSILDDMSYREIMALCKLYEYECKSFEHLNLTDKERADSFWDKFILDLTFDLGVRKQEVLDFLKRLERTGCYKTIDTFWGNDKLSGKLTTIFYSLMDLIEDK